MAISDYNKYKDIDVSSVSGTPTISRAVPIKITSGDDTTTGTGEIVLDWTNISSQSDISVYDENDNLLDFYFEKFDATNEVATIFVYRDWVRDGSTQAQIVYGNGSSDESVSSSTVFDKEVTNDGLVSSYLLSGTSGDVLDATSNNNDGTNNGATRGVSGQVGDAFDFTASDGDNVEVTSLSSYSSISVSFWINLDSITSGWNMVFDTLWGAENHQFSIESNNSGSSTFSLKNPDGTVSFGDLSSYVGEWALITATYDGSTYTTYINGNQINTGSGSSTIDLSGGVGIGARPGKNGEGTDGKIDDFRIYDTALSSDTITAYHDSTKDSPDFFTQQAAQSIQTNYTHTAAVLTLSTTDQEPTYKLKLSALEMSGNTQFVETYSLQIDGTITAPALTLSTTDEEPTFKLKLKSLEVEGSAQTVSPIIAGDAYNLGNIMTGTVGTAGIETDYPYKEGLIAGVTRHLE